MFYENNEVRIDENDQCITCENFAKGVNCPLIEALGMGVVFFDEELLVTNCGFYKEFKRHLKIVEE